MKATKSCIQKCYFLTFFRPVDDPVAQQLILLCAKGTRAVPDEQKVLLLSTNNSSSNINKVSVFGKGKYCFHRPKSKIVKLTLLDPNKKDQLMTTCILKHSNVVTRITTIK